MIHLEDWRFRKVFIKLGPRGFFSVYVVLGSKAFQRFFAPGYERMASSGRDNVEDKPIDGTIDVAGDEGESHHFQNEPPRGEHSRDD